MAQSGQYLRLVIAGEEYLLPSEASLSIEQRDNLVPSVRDRDAAEHANVTAWYVVRNERWPAFYLDADLQLGHDGPWQRGVFLEDAAHPVGLIVDEVQLLPPNDVRIEPFHPLGPRPTRAGHLFDQAWIRGDEVIMVFNPKTVVAYLKQLWRAA